MANFILICALLLLVFFALRSARKHFRGEGGCCGGGSDVPKAHKKLDAPKIGRRTLHIEGMHCKNCKNRVEQAINQMDGVVCRVNLQKREARISYSVPVSEKALCQAVESLGYQVTEIQ